MTGRSARLLDLPAGHRRRRAIAPRTGAAEVTAFLSWLAAKRGVSASTQNQASSALLFLNRHVLQIDIGTLAPVTRVKRLVRVPVVLTEEEATRLLSKLDGVVWIVVALLYGSGLQLQERLELRVTYLHVLTRGRASRRSSRMRRRSKLLDGTAEP